MHPPPPGTPKDTWLAEALTQLHRSLCRDTQPTDFIGLTLHSDHFAHGPVWIAFRLVSEFEPEDLLNVTMRACQSNDDAFQIDESFKIFVSIVSPPVGQGRVKLTHETVSKRSILSIRNDDNLCLPRSLVVAHVHAVRGQVRTGDLQTNWDKIRNNRGKCQTERARQLVIDANVPIPPNGCGLREIEKFQEYYARNNIAIVVYFFKTFGRGDTPFFDGTKYVLNVTNKVEYILRVMYYEDSHHYQPILNLVAAAGSKGYCIPCNKSFQNERDHRCKHKCYKCMQKPMCSVENMQLKCFQCNREFFGYACYNNHLAPNSFDKKHSVCQSIKICKNCCKTVRLCDKIPHKCGTVFCKICHKRQPVNHLCYLQPVKSQIEDKKFIFLFYDFETQQVETVTGDEKIKIHVPNLCVAQQVCSYCVEDSNISQQCEHCGVREYVFKRDPVREFIELALARKKKFQETVCIAHNAQGFDAQFILKYFVERTDMRDKVSVILNGSKIISMKILHLKFIDSLNYMHMSLSALPKAYGLSNIKKGTFPHLFNTPENENYVGEMPPLDTYSPDTMSAKDREEFLNWYGEKVAQGYQFDFQKEIIKYCKQDVEILRRACLAFRKTFLDCGSTDPFLECTTIASSCLRVYRKKFLKPNTIGIMPQRGYRNADKQSLKAIQWLTWMEKVLNRPIQHAGRSREKTLPEGPRVDGYCEEENGKGIVLQFHGCFWHGCPRCFTINRDTRLVSNENMDERYERTLKISEKIRESNYTLIEIWECEFEEECKRNRDISLYIQEKTRDFQEPLNPRDAYFGGRTGNTVKLYDVKDGEKIKYVDVCSLYPFICKYGKYPIGHPQLYVGEEECKRLIGPSNDLSGVEGLIHCEVLPPRNLFHPVLPVRMHNKLLFPLCRSCTETKCQEDCSHENPDERVFVGTWVADEIKKAVELGYTVTRVFEIWQYRVSQYDPAKRDGGLFHKYINKFFAEKTYASGYPPECENDEAAKNKLIADYEDREGILLDIARIAFNAGLRSVAKLCLNSLWGKFGQRENMCQTEVITDPQRLFELLTSPEIDVNSLLPVNDETIYVNWCYKDEALEPSPLVSVVVAAYTTALARLKLFSFLEQLDERVLYYDTDSIIYVSRDGSNEYEPPTGPFLGDLTDELAGYGPGTHITSFISGGPKFYGYKLKKPNGEESCVCKIKGIRLNYASSEKINFDSIRQLVTGEIPSLFVSRDAIRRTQFHAVVTQPECKKCQPVYEKRRFVALNKSYPYGYKKK